MAGMEKRRIDLRLIHDGAQPGTPLCEPLRFGLQDSKEKIHAGTAGPGGVRHFDLSLEVKGTDTTMPPVFTGAFAHGPPSARFLYLSWKREGEHEHPWGWRIKIPLAGIGWADIRAAERSEKWLEANLIGRRPHDTEKITWRLEQLSQPVVTGPARVRA